MNTNVDSVDRTRNATFLEDILKCGKQTFPPIGPWELVSYLKPVSCFILGLFDYAFEIKLVFMIKFLGMLGFADQKIIIDVAKERSAF